jgi:phage-related protein (TIGR01555 family)
MRVFEMTAREDGLASAMFGGVEGIGSAIQSALSGMAMNGAMVTDEWIEQQYARGGIAARIVDLPAEDAYARGFTIEGDTTRYILDNLDRLNLAVNGPTAIKWQRLYGAGAWVVFATDGSSTFAEPLREDNITSINEIVPVEASSLQVFQYYSDPRNPNYGRPEIYLVRVQGADNVQQTNVPGTGNATVQFKVHETRVIKFAGAPLPINLRRNARIPWQGRSDLGSVFEDWVRMQDSLKWSIEIMKKKQQAVHGMNGLGQLLLDDFGGKNEIGIRKRISFADAARNVLNGVTVDKEDDYTLFDLSLGGVVDVVKEFKEMLAGSCGFPVSVLFGRSASGLHANGDNDLEMYYGLVSKVQMVNVRPGLERMVSLLFKVKGAPKVPKWVIRFNPLWIPSEKDQAAAELSAGQGLQAKATAMVSVVTEGIISVAQATNYCATEGLFGLTPADRVVVPTEIIADDPDPTDIAPITGSQE